MPSSCSRPRTHAMSPGGTPPSITDDTNAANVGGAYPGCRESSGWMNTKPWNTCCGSGTVSYMCAPQPVQAWRCSTAFSFTTLSFSSCLVTLTLSLGTAASIENIAPSGFQHLVQPHRWLNRYSLSTATSTGSVLHLHTSVAPANPDCPCLTPSSTAGWMECLAMFKSSSWNGPASRRHGIAVADDRADHLAFVHQVERFIDLLQRQHLRDELVHLQPALHVLVDIARQLRAALDAAECGTAPDPSRHELERSRADLLPRRRDTDDGGLAPALVAALQRGTHHVDVADALERIVDATVGEIDDHLLDRPVMILGIHEVARAHRLRHRPFVGIDVDADDAAGLRHHRALHHRQTDRAQAEHGDGGTRPHLGHVEHRAHAGGDAATEQADLVQRRLRVDLRDRYFGQHGVFGKRAGAHVVPQHLALVRKPRSAIRHQALALGDADFLAQVGESRPAVFDSPHSGVYNGITWSPVSPTSRRARLPRRWRRLRGRGSPGTTPPDPRPTRCRHRCGTRRSRQRVPAPRPPSGLQGRLPRSRAVVPLPMQRLRAFSLLVFHSSSVLRGGWPAGGDQVNLPPFHVFVNVADLFRGEEARPRWHALGLAARHRGLQELLVRHAAGQRVTQVRCRVGTPHGIVAMAAIAVSVELFVPGEHVLRDDFRFVPRHEHGKIELDRLAVRGLVRVGLADRVRGRFCFRACARGRLERKNP